MACVLMATAPSLMDPLQLSEVKSAGASFVPTAGSFCWWYSTIKESGRCHGLSLKRKVKAFIQEDAITESVDVGEEMEPLLIQAARGKQIKRPPAWMMRQAGRYMMAYRRLTEKHPSFRKRSETTDLIVEISLQPWSAFHPDGVIIFSDILTPLPALGVQFDIEEKKGPVVHTTIRCQDGLKMLHPLDTGKLHFVGESLQILRKEVGDTAAVLGFVGAPWTIAAYIVEGRGSNTCREIRAMCHKAPELLRVLLSHLSQALSDYCIFQITSGAQCIQIFDSWGGQLPPHLWERWSKPYIEQIVRTVKDKCPKTPIMLYIKSNGGLLERMKETKVDVIGLDWTVDMADGRRRLGKGVTVQGNIDPAYLFGSLSGLTDEIHSFLLIHEMTTFELNAICPDMRHAESSMCHCSQSIFTYLLFVSQKLGGDFCYCHESWNTTVTTTSATTITKSITFADYYNDAEFGTGVMHAQRRKHIIRRT